MTEREGVIKFHLKFTDAPPLPLSDIWELNYWRKILRLNDLIGLDPARYQGVGFGNVSMRYPSPSSANSFVVSGTQTQHLADLSAEHYTLVTECSASKNSLSAGGPVKPSSEAITHGMIYELDPDIRFVMHVHCPAVWRAAKAMKIPLTHESAQFGTPEMANEVKRLFEESAIRDKNIFAMGGHEDGVVGFGRMAAEAGLTLLNCLVKART